MIFYNNKKIIKAFFGYSDLSEEPTTPPIIVEPSLLIPDGHVIKNTYYYNELINTELVDIPTNISLEYNNGSNIYIEDTIEFTISDLTKSKIKFLLDGPYNSVDDKWEDDYINLHAKLEYKLNDGHTKRTESISINKYNYKGWINFKDIIPSSTTYNYIHVTLSIDDWPMINGTIKWNYSGFELGQ